MKTVRTRVGIGWIFLGGFHIARSAGFELDYWMWFGFFMIGLVLFIIGD